MPEQERINTLYSSALRKHLDGDLPSAEALYREILSVCPRDADARHSLGFLLQQTDRLDEALEHLTVAISLNDKRAEWHFNLGIVLSRKSEFAAAIEAFCSAIAIDPGQYFYWTNLGASFESNQDFGRAEQCYLAATNIDPHCPDAFYLLAALCLKQQRFADARNFNYRGIVAAPDQSKSKIVLGQAYHELGRIADAIALFETWLQDEPDNPVAMHLLTACRGQSAPDQCSRQYIERTFDEFADSFEHTLGRLQYGVPQRFGDYLLQLDLPEASLDVLDLGCGTGLVGQHIKPFVRSLTGVDLSDAMLARAAEKRIYDRLVKCDIAEFLRNAENGYDLISCADTFIYIGCLDQVMKLIYRNLKVGGRLIFSIEKLDRMSECGFKLNISGRYSHHPDYLIRLLVEVGFRIEEMTDIDIRNEAGAPVAGQLVCALRTAHRSEQM